MIYKSTQFIQPFWAENGGFKVGRDPLGIQNSSVTVYGRLLPGMTNLTGRIRYYSFYCWLLQEYHLISVPAAEKTHLHQFNYIRRSELAMAFLMVNKYPAIHSVIGSDYAFNHKSECTEDMEYNLTKGADKPSNLKAERLYWDYLSGALGQYYAGSLVNLELIGIKDKYFYIEEKGKRLANAFEKSVPKNVRTHFLKLIKEGKMSKNDMDFIEPMCLNKIPIKSIEWQFLKELLQEKDGDRFKTRSGNITSRRVESIQLFLSSKSQGIPTDKFTEWIFQNIPSDIPIDTSYFGWHYYYTNEAVHYALEAIFWAFLRKLEGRICLLNDYLNEFNSNIQTLLSSKYIIAPDKLLKDVMPLASKHIISQKLNELAYSIRKVNEPIDAAAKAIELLLLIFSVVEHHWEKIKKFELENYINDQKGCITEHMTTYIKNNIDSTCSDFIDRVVKSIINDHMATAYRKMGNGDANLLKFIIEDNCIVHIETKEPQFTSPRTKTLHSLMLDLGFLNSDDTLTILGIDFLNELQ